MQRFWILPALALLGCSPGTPAPDAGFDAGFDAGLDAGFDGGLDGGLDGGPDAGLDAGWDGGAGDAGATVIRVHYSAGSHTMSLRGSLAPLSWSQGAAMQRIDPTTFEYTLPSLGADLELKPMLDDASWAKGPNWRVRPGGTIEVYPRFTIDAGTWSRRWTGVSSAILGNSRAVWVYLPPTYLENTAYRAPVLYMHDGQNLFDPAYAFGGVAWNVGQTMDQGAADGTIAEAIVIGPENTSARIDEYTPTADPAYGGGRGDLYLRFLIEELKPRVDTELRTLTGRGSTAMMGSSLGGLITAYAGKTHTDVFGLVGAMSPSVWWDGRMILGVVAQTPAAPNRPLRVYVDSGDQNDGQADTADLAAAYRALGYQDGTDFMYVLDPGASHSEQFWARRLPAALRFLLGPGR